MPASDRSSEWTGNWIGMERSTAKANTLDFLSEAILGREETRLSEADDNLPDSVLASRSASGDEGAFEEILRRYGTRVFRVCGKFFKRPSLVEEAAQETFLRAYTQLKNFEGRGSLEGWLTKIASTTCINIIRSQKRHPELSFADLSDNETDWLEDVLSLKASRNHHSDEQRMIAADLVDKVLGTLLPDDALILILTEGEGASIREAAEATGWTESKVKVRAFRARRRMREAVVKLLGADSSAYSKR